MTISKSGVRTLLIVLFALSVSVRLDSAAELTYPYYKGDSATNFRHASLIAESGRLPDIDKKSSWPDGYEPARMKANGIEYLTGFLFRVVEVFSDMSLKEFSGLLTVLVFSLCVFTVFGVTNQLVGSPAAGLFAAFLVALSNPVVQVTLGRDFLHGPFVILFISLHLYLFAKYRRHASTGPMVLMALVVFALLASWGTADLYLVVLTLLSLLVPGLDRGDRKKVLVTHALVAVLAGILIPNLRAERFIVGWPLIFLVFSTVYLFVKHTLPLRIHGATYVAVATVIVWLIATPFRASGIEQLSAIEYWFTRLRFLARPDDPLLIPDGVRTVWTRARAYPSALTLLEFYLPLLFLLPLSVLALRKRVTNVAFWLMLVIAFLGTAAFLLDRGAILAAALTVFPLAGLSVLAIDGHVKTRLIPVIVATGIVLTQAIAPEGKMNPSRQIASVLGASPAPIDGFLWISLGNADQELVRHLVSRTSVRNRMLAPPDISSLMVSFAGRTTVLTPGVANRGEIDRIREYMAAYYGEEKALYDLCRSLGVDYALYSVDLVLDSSNYSQRFVAGVRQVDESSLAYKMHFKPEGLRHFNLVYENDNYRLFKLTDVVEPVFVTDHPPVYQPSILKDHDGNLESFYQSVIDILVTYHTAIDAQQRRDDEDAIGRFKYCLDRAPRFTKAWLGLGDSLFRLGQIESAKAAYQRALRNAPDNALALYNTALMMARLGEVEEALGLIDVLLSSSRDPVLLRQGQDLKTSLEQGLQSEDS